MIFSVLLKAEDKHSWHQ